MHADTDQATYWKTMARLTGHSTRYLKVRACVRAMVCLIPVAVPFASILTSK